MDTLDRKALTLLTHEGRVTWSDLGQYLGMSAPSAAERVRKLEDRGIIKGYTAIADATEIGFGLLAFIFVTLDSQQKRKRFLDAILKMPGVLECHHVAGDDDYLLKIRCASTLELDELLSNQLKQKLGVARTRTIIALATAKETVNPL
ncbi:MAG: Lrp/AsnC family transcriptional regulator [Bryobacteraceae bacterium]|nr:Lrp/AsnC family transcriptional regulator [Bryobacteraceae bacterium]